MSSTVILTGMLPFVVLVAAALAFPVCALLLLLYRAAVLKGMRTTGGGTASAARTDPTQPPSSPLLIRTLTESSPLDSAAFDHNAYRRATLGPWRTAAVYGAAGMAYAAVMTAGWLTATRDPNIIWIKVLVLFCTYLWPAVLALLLVAAYDRTRRLQALVAYFGVFALLMAVAVARSSELGSGQLPLYWVLTNGPPSVLLLAFLARPIRAVGPMVLSFLIVAAVGSQAVLTVASTDEARLRAIADVGFALGLNAKGVFFTMILVGILIFAALGWPLLRWLGQRYERKKLSDQSISVDSLWLLFGVVQSIGLAFEAPPWILTGLVAFAFYKVVSSGGFFIALRTSPRTRPRTLLLLRVFALGKRSEHSFDRLRKHWQCTGSISMIAGPDLVTTTIEPHEFLSFLSGRVDRQFVKDAADLEGRLATADLAPDPDGRYRVNEFFCQADTWQMTMVALASRNDAVLMDLRSFAPLNQGCVFELGRLLDGVDLDRVVFLVDETTHSDFLQTTLQRLWQTLGANSPNRTLKTPTARLLTIGQQSERELTVLLRHLCGAKLAATG